MPINLTVKPHGTGTPSAQTVAGDAGDGFDATETAAIIGKMANADDTVEIAGKTYRNNSGTLVEVTAAPAPAPTPTTSLPNSYWGVGLEGGYGLGVGSYGHSGGLVNLRGEYGHQVANRFYLVPNLSLRYRGGSMDFNTPGGEAGSSQLHAVGGGIGLDARYVPPILDDHLSFSLGLGVSLANLMNPDNTYEDLPRITGDCPDGIGRAQCEVRANPGRANKGLTGQYDTRTGGARNGEGGLTVGFHIPLSVAYSIAAGDSLTLSPYVGLLTSYYHTNPNVGSGGGWWDFAPFGGISGTFGSRGGSAPRRTEETTPAPATDTAPAVERTAGEALSADEATIRTMGGLAANATILGVQFDNLAEDTTAPYEVPASAMTAGDHQLKIRYRNPGDTSDRIKIVPIRLGAAPVQVTVETRVVVNGTNVIMMPGNDSPRQGSGDKTIVRLQASQNKKIFVKLDNAAEQEITLQANQPFDYKVTEAALGGMAVDSAHNVTVRIDGDTQSYSFPFTVRAVRPPAPPVPATTTLTANPAGSGGRWDPHTVTVTSSGPLLPTDGVFLVHGGRPEVAAGTVGGTGNPTSFQVCIGKTGRCAVGGLSDRIQGDAVTIRVKRGSAVVGEVVWNAAAPRPQPRPTVSPRRRVQ